MHNQCMIGMGPSLNMWPSIQLNLPTLWPAQPPLALPFHHNTCHQEYCIKFIRHKVWHNPPHQLNLTTISEKMACHYSVILHTCCPFRNSWGHYNLCKIGYRPIDKRNMGKSNSNGVRQHCTRPQGSITLALGTNTDYFSDHDAIKNISAGTKIK